MVIDPLFAGGIPWCRFAVSQEVFDEFGRVEDVRKMDWDPVLGGQVTRVGAHADLELQSKFYRDIKQAAAALATAMLGEGLNPLDKNNSWAFFDDYIIEWVAAQCVNILTPKWGTMLDGYDGLIWDECRLMVQTPRID